MKFVNSESAAKTDSTFAGSLRRSNRTGCFKCYSDRNGQSLVAVAGPQREKTKKSRVT
jgi:hypothetical protein